MDDLEYFLISEFSWNEHEIHGVFESSINIVKILV